MSRYDHPSYAGLIRDAHRVIAECVDDVGILDEDEYEDVFAFAVSMVAELRQLPTATRPYDWAQEDS